MEDLGDALAAAGEGLGKPRVREVRELRLLLPERAEGAGVPRLAEGHVRRGDAARKGDFVIGVVRDRELATWLTSQSQGKKFGFQDVVVKNFKSVEEIVDCQVIYISDNINFERNAAKIIDKVGKDTLIMTEEEGATKHGSMINFVVRDNTLRFELSKSNAQMANIQFGQKLTDMSAAINL